MAKYKNLLLSCLVAVFLAGCGGAVESGPATTDDDTTAPNFVSGDPVGTVDTACSVTAEFDEAIDEATITDQSFAIVDDVTGTQLSAANGDGTWGLDTSSSTIALFAPSVTLTTNQYTVTITTDITDVAGNSLAAGTTWAFTQNVPCPP